MPPSACVSRAAALKCIEADVECKNNRLQVGAESCRGPAESAANRRASRTMELENHQMIELRDKNRHIGLAFLIAIAVMWSPVALSTAAADCEPQWILEFEGQEGLNGAIQVLAVFDDDSGGGPALYAGGWFTTAGGVEVNHIARWNGESWTALGSGMDDVVFALTVYDDGSGPALYAGGMFTTAGGVEANYIAKWDGKEWYALGTGMSDWVFALTVFDDSLGSGKALYAGGDFIAAGGVTVNYIARWKGSSWSDLGLGGMNNSVRSLAAFEDDSGPVLYAGGEFTIAGGVEANRIARWNGSAWSQLSSGISGCPSSDPFRPCTPVVNALAAFDDGDGPALYVGGNFTNAGGVSASRIAKWDDSSWSALETGVDGVLFGVPTVEALEVFDDGTGPALYAGGRFGSAGGVSVNNIARWNGEEWSPLGMGIQGLGAAVFALTAFDEISIGGPALYVGGNYSGSEAVLKKWLGCPTVVHVPVDAPSIQAGIALVADGGEVIVAPGTYNEAIDFMGKAVHLYSSDGPEVTTIDATGLDTSVVTANSGEGSDTIVEGFTITGGTGSAPGGTGPAIGGGMKIVDSSPTIINCTIEENTAQRGGAVAVIDGGTPSFVNSRFLDNSVAAPLGVTAYGGAMYVSASAPSISNSIFQGNSSGGGIQPGAGGAMANRNASHPTVEDCLFENNIASSDGGGIYNSGASNPTLNNCQFQANSAELGSGGGMFNSGSSPTIENCRFEGNSALGGGGMANQSNSNPHVIDSEFTSNTASVGGGGIASDEQSLPALETTSLCNNSPSHITGPWDDLGGNTLSEFQCDAVMWTGGGSSNSWHDPANWSSNPVLPGADDHVGIPAGFIVHHESGSGTTTVESIFCLGTLVISGSQMVVHSESTIATLQMSNGSAVLRGSGDVTITQELIWQGGHFRGAGTTVLAEGAVGTMSGATHVSHMRLGRTFENYGEISYTGDRFRYGSGNEAGLFINKPGGEFHIVNNGGINVDDEHPDHAFENQGLLRKSGTGASIVNQGVRFDNGGTVEVWGTFRVQSNGNHSGPFWIAEDAQLWIEASSHSFSSLATVSGQGELRLSGSGSRVFDTAVEPDSVWISGGNQQFNAASSIPVLRLSNAGTVLRGSGDITVTDHFLWNAGHLRDSGRLLLSAGATAMISGISPSINRLGRVFENHGSVSYTGTSFRLGSSSQPGHFINAPLGEFNITGSGSIAVDFDHPDHTFENHGVFIKTGTGTSNINDGVNFDNAGTVTADAGLLQFRNEGVHTGPFMIGADAVLRFESNHTFNGGATVAGEGELQLASSGSRVFNTAVEPDSVWISGGNQQFNAASSVPTLRLSNGGTVLRGSGDITVTDHFLWNAGHLRDSGKLILVAGATATISGFDGSAVNRLGRVFENYGTVSYTGNLLRLGSSNQPGHFINTSQGEFDIVGSGNINVDFAHPDHTFENHGVFIKTGTGTSNINDGVSFDNAGIVTASAGTLEIRDPVNLSGGTLSGGTWNVVSPGLLRFASGNNVSSLDGGASVLLDGPGASFTSLNSLAMIESGASLSLSESHSYTSGASSFTLRGSLTVDAGSSFGATGDYLQQSDGSLTMMLQSASEIPMAISGMAMPGGHVTVVARDFDPMKGPGVTILTATGGVSGEFASATLPMAGDPLKQIVLDYLPGSVVLDEGYYPGSFVGEDGGDWFDPENWGAGEVPGSNTDVLLPVRAVIEAGDAYARDVLLMADGGGLTITGAGSLTADVVTAETGATFEIGNGWLHAVTAEFLHGSTLVLNDADALLRAETLTFLDGMTLTWTAGTIEIDGGSLNHPWYDFHVGGSTELSMLRLINGAAAAVPGDLFIGPENTVGAVEIDGTASHISVGIEMFIGISGDGSLSIRNGGSAASAHGTIALFPGSEGAVEVTGAASSWNMTGLLMVGAGGTGELHLDDGATVQAPAIAIYAGLVAGHGTLVGNVSNDGQISPGTSTGVLSITGNYEQWSEGALEIEIAGELPGEELDVLQIAGSAMLDGALSIVFIDRFMPEADAVLTFLTASDGVTGTFTDVFIDDTDDPYLIVDLAFDPSAVSMVTLYPDGFYIGESGGDWFDESNWIGGVPSAQTNVILTGSAQIEAGSADAESILVTGSGALTVMTGALTASTIEVESGGVLELLDDASLIEAGWIDLSAGASLHWQAGTIAIDGGLVTAAALEIGCNLAAMLVLDEAVVDAPEIVICESGTLRGTGWVGKAVYNAGLIEPGLPIGQLNLLNSYSQSESGVLMMDLAGLMPGQAHDVLSIGEQGSLNGTLELVLSGGFEPALLDEFVLVQANDGVGEFSTVIVPELGGVLLFGLVYSTEPALFEVTARVTKIGDLTGNGVVNSSDLLILLNAWGACPGGDCPADLNGDGVVNSADLLILLDNWD